MRYIITLFLTLFVFISCKNNKYEKIHAMIMDIEESMTSENLEKLKNLSENKLNDQFDYPIYYRDNILISEDNKSNVEYFNSLGIENTSDMANILFTVLHRKLNNKQLEVDSLVKLSLEGKTVFSPR